MQLALELPRRLFGDDWAVGERRRRRPDRDARTVDGGAVWDTGKTVTYTLRMNNTGVVTDTFALDYSGSNWEVGLPVTNATLVAGTGMDVMVYVSIPVTATGGMTDTTQLAATGTGVSDTSTLITAVTLTRVYLPLVLKD